MIQNKHNWEYNLYTTSIDICFVNAFCMYIVQIILFQKKEKANEIKFSQNK